MSFHDSDQPTPPGRLSADDTQQPDLPLADLHNLDEIPVASIEPLDDEIPIVMPIEEVPVVQPLEVECWRCGWYDTPEYGRCARCDARVRPRRRRRPRAPGTGGPSRLAVVLIAYGLLIFTCIAWGMVLLTSRVNLTEDETRIGLAIMEGIDTILVLLSLALVGRIELRDAPPGSAAVAWSLAGPVLFALICGNVLFSAVLRELLRAPAVPGPGVTFATIMLICVQPAIVEELFFRHVALGAMRREMSLRMTILVTSVMFAVAHLHNPLGMPYLFIAGVVFGYARVYGGLGLSMLMHFLHNLAVILIDSLN